MHLCGQSGMPLAGRKPGEGTRAEAASPGTAGVLRIRDACWWTRSEARSACRCRDRTRGLGCVGKEREAHAKQRGCENLRESRACSSMMRRGMIQKQVLRHALATLSQRCAPRMEVGMGSGTPIVLMGHLHVTRVRRIERCPSDSPGSHELGVCLGVAAGASCGGRESTGCASTNRRDRSLTVLLTKFILTVRTHRTPPTL